MLRGGKQRNKTQGIIIMQCCHTACLHYSCLQNVLDPQLNEIDVHRPINLALYVYFSLTHSLFSGCL